MSVKNNRNSRFSGKLGLGIHAPLLSWQVYNALKAGSVFLIAIIFARGGASLSFIADYEALMLWGGMLSFFYVSGFSQAWISWIEHLTPQQQQHAPKILFQTLQIPALITGGIFMGYFLISDQLVHLAFGVYLCFHIPAFAIESYVLKKNHSRKILVLGLWTYLSYLLIIACIFFMTKKLLPLVLALTIWALVRWLYTKKQIDQRIPTDKVLWRNFLEHASPLALSLLLGGSLIYVNALLVQYFMPPKEFVLFRYGAREFPLFMIMANAFSTVYSGIIASRYEHESMEDLNLLFKNKTRRLMHQLYPMALGLMLLAPFLFKMAYGSELASSWVVFSIMLLLTISRVMFPQTLLVATKNTKILMEAAVIELFTGTLLSYFLIPEWGINGAAAALVLAFMAEKLFLVFRCHQIGIEYLKAFPFKTFFVYSILLIACFLFMRFTEF